LNFNKTTWRNILAGSSFAVMFSEETSENARIARRDSEDSAIAVLLKPDTVNRSGNRFMIAGAFQSLGDLQKFLGKVPGEVSDG